MLHARYWCMFKFQLGQQEKFMKSSERCTCSWYLPEILILKFSTSPRAKVHIICKKKWSQYVSYFSVPWSLYQYYSVRCLIRIPSSNQINVIYNHNNTGCFFSAPIKKNLGRIQRVMHALGPVTTFLLKPLISKESDPFISRGFLDYNIVQRAADRKENQHSSGGYIEVQAQSSLVLGHKFQ